MQHRWIPNISQSMDSQTSLFERLHAEGWHLEKQTLFGWRFRRGTPEQTQYRLFAIPGLPQYPKKDDPRLEEAEALCAESGWELVLRNGPLLVCRAAADNPVPLHTDETVHLRTLARIQLERGLILAVLLLFLAAITGLARNAWRGPLAFSLVTDPACLWAALSLCALGAYFLLLLVEILVWYLRSSRSVRQGGSCVPLGPLSWIGGMLFLVEVFLFLLTLAGSAILDRNPRALSLLVSLLGYGVLVTCVQYAWKRAGDAGAGQGQQLAVILVTATVLSLAGTFLDGTLFPDLYAPQAFLEYEEETFPLTLRDLGVSLPDGTKELTLPEQGRSLLGSGASYRMLPDTEEMAPVLEVSTVNVPSRTIRGLLLRLSLRQGREGPYSLAASDAWNADAVWTQRDSAWLAIKGNRIMWVELQDGPPLTEEQVALAVERLAGWDLTKQAQPAAT